MGGLPLLRACVVCLVTVMAAAAGRQPGRCFGRRRCCVLNGHDLQGVLPSIGYVEWNVKHEQLFLQDVSATYASVNMEHPVAAVAWFLDPPRRRAALWSILTHSPSPAAGTRPALASLSLAFLQSYDEEISKTLVLSGIVSWKREKRSEMP